MPLSRVRRRSAERSRSGERRKHRLRLGVEKYSILLSVILMDPPPSQSHRFGSGVTSIRGSLSAAAPRQLLPICPRDGPSSRGDDNSRLSSTHWMCISVSQAELAIFSDPAIPKHNRTIPRPPQPLRQGRIVHKCAAAKERDAQIRRPFP